MAKIDQPDDQRAEAARRLLRRLDHESDDDGLAGGILELAEQLTRSRVAALRGIDANAVTAGMKGPIEGSLVWSDLLSGKDTAGKYLLSVDGGSGLLQFIDPPAGWRPLAIVIVLPDSRWKRESIAVARLIESNPEFRESLVLAAASDGTVELKCDDV
jgi:hypothetical protein